MLSTVKALKDLAIMSVLPHLIKWPCTVTSSRSLVLKTPAAGMHVCVCTCNLRTHPHVCVCGETCLVRQQETQVVNNARRWVKLGVDESTSEMLKFIH